MRKIIEKNIEAFVKLFLVILTLGILSSCTSYRLASYYEDPLYPTEFVIPVTNETKIDTLDSFGDLKWKLRTDFKFRYDFATYAVNQPMSWYFSNRLFRNNYWSPFNSFDIYFDRHNYWYDWAFNYPYDFGWSWNRWNYRWGYLYNWHRPYHHWNNWYLGPWQNPSYNVIWNSSRIDNANIAYIHGRRGSRSNIRSYSGTAGNTLVNYNVPRRVIENINNDNNSNIIDRTIRNLRNRGLNVRIINNVNNLNNDQIIRSNSGANWSTQSRNNGRGSWSRQNIPPQSTPTWQSTSVQPRQIRGGSGSSVSQQVRSGVSTGSQGRSSSSRRQN